MKILESRSLSTRRDSEGFLESSPYVVKAIILENISVTHVSCRIKFALKRRHLERGSTLIRLLQPGSKILLVCHTVPHRLLTLHSSLVHPPETAEKQDTNDSAFDLGGLRMNEEAE